MNFSKLRLALVGGMVGMLSSAVGLASGPTPTGQSAKTVCEEAATRPAGADPAPVAEISPTPATARGATTGTTTTPEVPPPSVPAAADAPCDPSTQSCASH